MTNLVAEAMKPADHVGTVYCVARWPRRIAALLYESVVLFGMVLAVGLLFSILIQQHHALSGRRGMQVAVFVMLGCYFIWFWSHGGQTVAMRAWRLRLVMSTGTSVPVAYAALRYLAAWLWLVPALAIAHVSPWQGQTALCSIVTTWMVVYAASSTLNSEKQFWHDRICGTRLIHEKAS